MDLKRAQVGFDVIADALWDIEGQREEFLNLPEYVFSGEWRDLPVELKIKNAQWLQELGKALESDPEIAAWFKENR